MDNSRQTNWQVEYDDVEPIHIRDPVAEALAVLDPGEPFVVSYTDVVKAAGHSCPTAAGAYRLTQMGLAELYPSSYPVRGEIAVLAGGPKADAAYGVLSGLLSYITGAAEETGFGGLAGGYGGRKQLLSFDAFDTDETRPVFRFRRTDTGKCVKVVYHTDDVPDAGPAREYLPKLIEESADAEERKAFRAAWHSRVRAVLSDDNLFTITIVEQ